MRNYVLPFTAQKKLFFSFSLEKIISCVTINASDKLRIQGFTRNECQIAWFTQTLKICISDARTPQPNRDLNVETLLVKL